MIEIKDITYKEYFEIDPDEIDTYNRTIRYAIIFNKSEDHFNLGDFMKIPFGIVKDLQYDLSNGLGLEQAVDYMCQISGKPLSEFINKKLITICQQRQYMVDEITRLTDIEAKTLSGTLTDEQIEAGIEMFGIFGVYMQLRDLAGNDVTKIESVRQIPYETCFLELYVRSKYAEYEDNYQNIMNRRARNS